MNRRWLVVLVALVATATLAAMASGPVSAQEGAPQPERCAQACRERAQAELKACLATGAAPERCRERVGKALEQCVERCRRAAQVAPDPGQTAPRACEQRCAQVGRSVMKACLALPIGPTREQCQRRAKEAVRLCEAKLCPPKEEPEPRTCEEQCAARAREYYQRCVAGSTGTQPPEECSRLARQMQQECLQRCKRASVAPDPAPAPSECRQKCRERVAAFVADCKAQPGANPERCEAQGTKKLEACVAQCK